MLELVVHPGHQEETPLSLRLFQQVVVPVLKLVVLVVVTVEQLIPQVKEIMEQAVEVAVVEQELLDKKEEAQVEQEVMVTQVQLVVLL